MRRFGIAAAMLILSLSASGQEDTVLHETASQKSTRLQWWRQGRFGMFIHWGPISLKGTEISWSRGGARRGIEGTGEIPVDVYDSLYTRFNPVKFDASEWVAVARAAGMKYMVLTAKHCDGFCLWDSRVDAYSMSHTPFKRDICGELAGAAHSGGMRIGWYYSPMDWRDPDCRTERNAVYIDRMLGHLRELLQNYGRIDLLWFDHDGGPAPWDQERTYTLVRSLQPRLVINNRLDCGSMKDIEAQKMGPNADYYTPEQRVGAFDTRRPWETCMTIGTQWAWKPKDTIKTAGECIRILVQCATGDGNLLLNVGPMPDGRIEPRQVSVLKSIGAWLRKYGESIYGTRGGPFRNGVWGGSTRNGNAVYLHIVKWDNGEVRLPVLPAKIRSSRILTSGKVSIEQNADGLTVRFRPDGSPARRRSQPGTRYTPDTIVRLDLDRSADEIEPIGVQP